MKDRASRFPIELTGAPAVAAAIGAGLEIEHIVETKGDVATITLRTVDRISAQLQADGQITVFVGRREEEP